MKRIVRDNFDISVEGYDAYERRTGRLSALAERLVDEMVRARGGDFDRLLEAGAGTGAGTTELEPHVGELIALDASRGMLARNPAERRVLGDIDRLPLVAQSVDGVAYTASLFLVPDPVVAAREASRVLRPGGVVGAVASVGWVTPDGRDAFADLPRESRQPNGPDVVAGALESAVGDSVSGGEWSFETTPENVRAFHATPAGAARIYPKLPPEERVAAARNVLEDLPERIEHRWRWFVATA